MLKQIPNWFLCPCYLSTAIHPQQTPELILQNTDRSINTGHVDYATGEIWEILSKVKLASLPQAFSEPLTANVHFETPRGT